MRPHILQTIVLIAALACGACTSVCARTWEATTTVGHEYGLPAYSQSATIGGGIGSDECTERGHK